MANRVAAQRGGLADALPDKGGRLLLMALALDTVAGSLRRSAGRRLDDLRKLYREGPDDEKVLIDVKGLYRVEDLKASGMKWWRL